jgi:UDPglucose 6-dehydrogenase
MVRNVVASTLATRIASEALAEPLAFDVASNPEFLKEGMAIEDFMRPSRVVIGVDSQRACQYLKELYAPFVARPEQLLWMDVRSAELAKYASNAMLATRISFMNGMAMLAETFGANIEDIRTVMGMDPRIGAQYLHPGPGYGGSCFPKDMKALIHMAKAAGLDMPLLTAVEEVNRAQKERMFQKISAHFNGELKGRIIAVWGLAFKAGTDDIRDSASTVLIYALLNAGANVVAYDALAAGNFTSTVGTLPGLSIVLDAHTALTGAEALVIMTDPEAFKTVDYGVLKASLASPVIFDARNMFDPVLMESLGFTYISIGRHTTRHCEGALASVAI